MPRLKANGKGGLLMLERQTGTTTSKSEADSSQDLNDDDDDDDEDDDDNDNEDEGDDDDEDDEDDVEASRIVPIRPISNLKRPGVTFNILANWNASFQQLQAFQREHRHCRVPHTNEYTSLYYWVTNQRNRRCPQSAKANRPHPQQEIDLLDSIGFIWNPKQEYKDRQWEKQFQCLNRYKMKHGDCRVKRTRTYNSLGNWVQKQRGRYKKGELKKEQKTRLENIGFAWTCQRPDRSYQVAQTVTPKRRLDSSGHAQNSIDDDDDHDDDDACSEEDKVEAKTSRTKRKRKEADSSRDDLDRKQEFDELKLPPTNSPASTSLDIGTRVAVYWVDADEYYSGTVSRKFGRTAFVDYDDGGSEWIDVKKHKFEKIG